jgi:WhiB family redox-sensing transcriptional regulator
MLRFARPADRQQDDQDWYLSARCRGADPSLFFHPDGERGRARQVRQRQAKQICETCPVMTRCRDHAVQHGEAFGTWGGLSEEDRRRADGITRHRPRWPQRATPEDDE